MVTAKIFTLFKANIQGRTDQHNTLRRTHETLFLKSTTQRFGQLGKQMSGNHVVESFGRWFVRAIAHSLERENDRSLERWECLMKFLVERLTWTMLDFMEERLSCRITCKSLMLCCWSVWT